MFKKPELNPYLLLEIDISDDCSTKLYDELIRNQKKQCKTHRNLHSEVWPHHCLVYRYNAADGLYTLDDECIFKPIYNIEGNIYSFHCKKYIKYTQNKIIE